MPDEAGLYILNDFQQIVIDSKFQNLCVIAKGTGSCATGSTTTITHMPMDYPPLVFLRPDFYGLTEFSFNMTGGKYTSVTLLCSNYGVRSVNFEWALVGPPPETTTTETGLQVFNAETDLVFDSDFPYMKIIGALTPTFDLNGISVIMHDYVNKPWYSIAGMPKFVFANGDEGGTYPDQSRHSVQIINQNSVRMVGTSLGPAGLTGGQEASWATPWYDDKWGTALLLVAEID